MQASTKPWVPPSGALGRILESTRTRVAALRGQAAELEHRALDAKGAPPFASALRGDRLAVIAEIKRRSPSKGDINPGLTPALQARAYTTGGAAAISVLTESAEFGGNLNDLAEARRGSGLPLLRKDFIIDPVQIAEARIHGASAVLLIARALTPAMLADLTAAAATLGVEAFIEVRDEDELERTLSLPVTVIGVNSRDLETLHVDPGVPARLLPLIPSDRIAVAESGITNAVDAARAAHAGADAVLVGSALSASGDPAGMVQALAAVPRAGRARRD